MASPLHDGLIRLLRDRPALLGELVGEALGLPGGGAAALQVADTQLTEVLPREHRSDLVLTVGGERPSRVVIVEAQLRTRRDKPQAWLSYVQGAMERYRVPARLVVLAPNPRVAAWAAGPFDFEGSSVVLRPHVISVSSVPLVAEPSMGARYPEAAMFSLLFHHADPRVLPVMDAAITALAHLDSDRARDYSEVAWQALAAALRPAWEKLMTTARRKLVPPFVLEWERKGEQRGLVRGREEGREEGRTGVAAMLLALLEQRGLTVSQVQRRRIVACPSMLTLQRWMGRALVVHSVSELLAPAITRARRG